MSWYSWEKALHSKAAKEDAEKLSAELSSLFHKAISCLIYPTDLHRFIMAVSHQLERLQNPQGFLQEALSCLGFEKFNIEELLIDAFQHTYKFITSDLDGQILEPHYQDIVENYTNLLYRVYPAFRNSHVSGFLDSFTGT